MRRKNPGRPPEQVNTGGGVTVIQVSWQNVDPLCLQHWESNLGVKKGTFKRSHTKDPFGVTEKLTSKPRRNS